MSLMDVAERAVAARKPSDSQVYGPWRGSMRSRSAEQVPPEYISGGSDYLYLPRTGTWKRRDGQTQKFDTFGASVGLLEAKYTSKGRQVEEFLSSFVTDGMPTMCALASKEIDPGDLDDGNFSSFWLRDQVNNVSYVLGSDFSDTTYSEPAGSQSYKFIPLWYDSGDGGVTRGATEMTRRFLTAGSRKFLKVGNEHYFPNYRGTPCRWLRTSTGVAEVDYLPNSDISVCSGQTIGGWGLNTGAGGDAGACPGYASVNTDNGYTNYITRDQIAGTHVVKFGLDGTLDSTVRSWRVTFSARRLFSIAMTAGTYNFTVVLSNGDAFTAPTALNCTDLTDAWVTYVLDLSQFQSTGVSPQNYVDLTASFPGTGTGYMAVSYIKVEPLGAGAAAGANRLTPSGPVPMTHAGTIAAGTQVENSATYARPTSDITDGAWVKSSDSNNTDLYTMIDEVTPSDTDYISTPLSGSSSTVEVGLADLGITPSPDDTVVIRYRARHLTGGGGYLRAYFMEGANIRASWPVLPYSTSFADYAVQLTPAQISSVTAWTGLRMRFTKEAPSIGTSTSAISWLTLEHTAGASTFQQTLTGGWRGSDKFYYGVAPVFEDGSIWMPTIPRGPSALLAAGFNLFQVDAANPTSGYQSITWSNLPVPMHGIKKLALLRTLKIDASTESILQLNPFELRVVAVVDAGVTTYEDFYANDASLVLDPDRLRIRWDHMMPPAARYIAGGPQRIVHMYGRNNPAAIVIAPIGRTADYDLNLADTNSTLYSQSSMYMRVGIDTAGAGTLLLIKSDGTTITSESITLTATLTLDQLVDTINATSCAVDSQQWRAQLMPGASGSAIALTALTPHYREIATCVVDDTAKTITKAAGGLGKAAVGQKIQRSGTATGAYVTRIDSDAQLTYSGTITTGTATLSFYNELGDAPTAATADNGYQRVISNSLWGALYFNRTYLDTLGTEKQATWMTVATPASVRSAPNCFRDESRQVTNVFRPPLDAGNVQGGYAVDNGFVIWYGGMRGVIVNRKDAGSGADQDFGLEIRNEHRGCCAWNTIVGASSFGFACTPEGFVAANIDREVLISPDIWLHPRADAMTGVGDFDVEMPLCVAATASDQDNAYMAAKVLRGVLWVTYRKANATRPDRMVAYDFSDGSESAGIDSIFRREPLIDPETRQVVAPAGSLFGWGTPLVRAMTALGGGHRSDGFHLYGWNDANAGSVGDGRIDEFETSDTDNGTAIAASVQLPWLRNGDGEVAGQRAVVFHSSPAASTGSLEFWRGLSSVAAAQTLSLSTSALLVTRDVKELLTSVRAPADGCHWRYIQATGGARELKRLDFTFKRFRRIRPT